MVMGLDYFLRIYERINSLSITDPESRLFKRLILSSAYKVDLDKAGRILVPTNLRQFLSLTEATLVGQGDYFEVWTTSDWDLQIKNLFNTEANSKRFAMLDLSMRK
jgi:MraZ protein